MSRLDAVGDHSLRTTALFVRAQARSVTADDVARALALPRTVARWRLEKLAAAGLLDVAFERRSGRSGRGAGRPAKTYAPAAETAAIEFPRRRYETLASLLMAALPARRRSALLSQVGIEYGKELATAARLRRARTIPGALKSVCRGLGRLGFQAAVKVVSDEQAVILSATCPLRPLVVAEPNARAIDEGMWRGLVEAAAGRTAARVTCRTQDCLDGGAPCRIVISLAAGG